MTRGIVPIKFCMWAALLWIAAAAMAQDEGVLASPGGDPLKKVIKGGVLFENEKIETVISLIGADAEITITKTAGVQGAVTVNFPGDVEVGTLLDTITGSIGARYQVDANGIIKIMTAEEFAALQGPAATKRVRYQIQNRAATDLVKALEPLLTENIGQMTVDPANNTITVLDTLEAHNRIRQEIENLDTPLKTIIFNLRYVSAQEVAETLKTILVGEPDIQVNVRLNQVILRDTITNILRAQQYVEQIDKDRELRIYHINFAWEQFDEIAGLVERFASEDAVIETYEERRLIIVEDIPPRQERIAELIKAIDLPTRQVLIEAEIVRISNNLNFEFGSQFDYANRDIARNIGNATGTLSPLDTASSFDYLLRMPETGNITFFGLHNDKFRFQIRALEGQGLAETISSPRIVVRNDQDASMKVATEEPYASRQTRRSEFGGTGDDFYSQRSREVGSLLEVTPHIMDNGYVDMEIFLEDSDAERVTLEASDLDALRVFKRTAETRLVVRDGRSIAIGGLYERRRTQQRTGLPWLSRIPIIGLPFRLNTDSDQKQKLVLFVTPRIVSLDDPFGRRHDYDQSQFGAESELLKALPDYFPEERKYENDPRYLKPGELRTIPWSSEETEMLYAPSVDPDGEPVDLLRTVIHGGVELNDSVQGVAELLSGGTGVPIKVDPELKGSIVFSAERDITLKEVLDVIGASLGAGYTVREGAIWLAPRGKVISTPTSTPAAVEPADKPAAASQAAPQAAPAAAPQTSQSGPPLERIITGGVDFDNVDVRDAVAELARRAGVAISVSRQVKGKVFWAAAGDVTLGEALDKVAAAVGARRVQTPKGEIELITNREWLRERAPAKLVRREFTIQHLPVETAKAQIEPLLSEQGTASIDTSGNKLLVEDSVAAMSKISEAVKQLDAAASPAPEPPRAQKRAAAEQRDDNGPSLETLP